MYWYIDDEAWVSNGGPLVTEMHGQICDEDGEPYGQVLTDDEETEVRAALLAYRLQPALDLD